MPTSAFGEAALVRDDGWRVEERANKLVPIPPHVAIASSGDEHAAAMFINHLAHHAGMKDRRRALRETYEATHDPRDAGFVLLIAHVGPDGKPELLRFDSARPDEVVAGDWFLEGSADDQLRDLIVTFEQQFGNEPVPPARYYAGLLAFMQYLTMAGPFFTMGIGGTFHSC